MATVLFGPIDLLNAAGINYAREALYTATVDSEADPRPGSNAVYWVVRTVDKDSSTKRWDAYVLVAPGDGRVILHHRFRQGDPYTPKALGAASISVAHTGVIYVTLTEDVAEGGLWPPQVFALAGWAS